MLNYWQKRFVFKMAKTGKKKIKKINKKKKKKKNVQKQCELPVQKGKLKLGLIKKYSIGNNPKELEANRSLHLGCVWRIPKEVYENLEIQWDNRVTSNDRTIFWEEVEKYNSCYGIFFSRNPTNNNIKLRAWTVLRNTEILQTESQMTTIMEGALGTKVLHICGVYLFVFFFLNKFVICLFFVVLLFIFF